MTDEQIIKSLKYCNTDVRENTCPKCAFYKKHRCSTLMLNAVSDLINRQKAEIEKLKVELKAMRGAANSYKLENERLLQKLQQAKSEAIKEFAERLKMICGLTMIANIIVLAAVMSAKNLYHKLQR